MVMATMIVREFAPRLWQLTERQHGVVTRPQLLQAGLSAAAIKHRVSIGRLHPLARGVYAVGRPQVSREGRWLAATLSCGPEAALSHDGGVALCGIAPGPVRMPIDVTVPEHVRHRRPGVRLHSARLDAQDVGEWDGVPVLSPARLLLGRATTVGARQLERDVNAADIHGLIGFEDLQAALPRFAGLNGVAALRDLVLRHSFTLTDSELERRFLPLARRAGLTDPLTRHYVNGFRVDFFWPRLALVVETDGLRLHRTPLEQGRDLVREQTHKAAGVEPLRYTHYQVAFQPKWVERTLRDVAARRDREMLWRP